MKIEEHYKTEDEMVEELNELYGTVQVAHLQLDAGRVLRDYDGPFFDACIAESLQWECGVCGTLFDKDEKDEAEECCQDDEDLDEEDEE